MKDIKVTRTLKLGKLIDVLIVSIVILLNELAAFLYIRDHVADEHSAYGIAAFAVFCSTYIVFKFIARK